MRQRVLFCVFAALLMTSGPSHGQQAGHTYPTRQVRMVVPYPAGGPTDLIGRLLAQKLGEQLGQSFYVENIAGASGALGAGQVAQAAADGHTLLVVTNDFAVASVASSKMTYDPSRASRRSQSSPRPPRWSLSTQRSPPET
jgi:tripartite-type tricarboxylate transporter receptor subunit TctC